jgi:FMN phosphatase YigB (HAD superfamily)
MEGITTIFFDLGDTLYSNKELEKQYPYQLSVLLSEGKHVSIEEAENLIKQKETELEGKLKHVTKVSVMEALGYTRGQVHDAFCKVDPSQYLSPNPLLKQLLKRLRKKYELGMITNFRRMQVEKTLEVLGLDASYFQVIVGEEDVKEIKPSHEPFLKATQLVGKDPKQCVYVADSATKDLMPAKEVGMKTILVGTAAKSYPFVDAQIADILQLERVISA